MAPDVPSRLDHGDLQHPNTQASSHESATSIVPISLGDLSALHDVRAEGQDKPPIYTQVDTGVSSPAATPSGSLQQPSASEFGYAPSQQAHWAPYFPPTSAHWAQGSFHPHAAVAIHSPIPQLAFSPHEIPLPHIEDPNDLLYRKQRSEELDIDLDVESLVAEINGDRVVPVHGCGIWAYSGHTSAASEELKQIAWKEHASRESWINSARARTLQYSRPGVLRPPLRWVLVDGENDDIPDNALQTGTEADGEKLYSARTWWRGGLHIGKAGSHLQDGRASVSFDSLEHPLSTFEVLVGDSAYAKWVSVLSVSNASLTAEPCSTSDDETSGATPTERLLENYMSGVRIAKSKPKFFLPLEGGREADGKPLFVAQAAYGMGWHPGKAGLDEDHCCIGYGGGEVWVRTFRILVYDLDAA